MLADLLFRVCARRVVLNGWPGDLPFQKRRSAAFEADSAERDGVCAKVAVERGDDLPGLRFVNP